MRRIALISCTKSKQAYPCQAKKMYRTSNLFTKAVSYIEKQEYDDWFILSAKHGLLNKETLIDPYDITLLSMNAKQRKDWSHNVFFQLRTLSDCEFDFYAGSKYREYLIPLLKKEDFICRIPLQGLPIGKQLQYYKQALNDED
ncbi:DUF6884 domain-containing protein [Virgibacillus litoralis]|uniref:DUF6884 domain-containing protein n=1 Tax=Virgibacillus litoralis TaxID=578221 RepID=A0ABS4HG45_9BACI|nr:DUF6884 domain-containing protein [Virgibacillus litoralis]MBP1949890.1 hypothetical protein [Virgibacillus litoralis]